VLRKGLQPLVLQGCVKNAPINAGKRSLYECLLTPTAEDALVRAMCNASPSAMVGSGQPTRNAPRPIWPGRDSC